MRAFWKDRARAALAGVLLLPLLGLQSCLTEKIWEPSEQKLELVTTATRMKVAEIRIGETEDGAFVAAVGAHSPKRRLPHGMRHHDGSGLRWFLLEPVGEGRRKALPGDLFAAGRDQVCVIRIHKDEKDAPRAQFEVRGRYEETPVGADRVEVDASTGSKVWVVQRECLVSHHIGPPLPRRGCVQLPVRKTYIGVTGTRSEVRRGGMPTWLRVVLTPPALAVDIVTFPIRSIEAEAVGELMGDLIGELFKAGFRAALGIEDDDEDDDDDDRDDRRKRKRDRDKEPKRKPGGEPRLSDKNKRTPATDKLWTRKR